MSAEQGSVQWLSERAGKVTASRLADVLARTKSGPSTSRANYLAELVAERLTGEPTESYVNAAMQRGTDLEPQARAAYSFAADLDVIETGLVIHPRIPDAGASPDGLVGDDGLIEIKCFDARAKHLGLLLGSSIDAKHFAQMQWQMSCTGRAWCDYVSFDPRWPAHLRLHITRVERDDDFIANAENEVTAFLAEVEKAVASLSPELRKAA